jgi:hypothetical protein
MVASIWNGIRRNVMLPSSMWGCPAKHSTIIYLFVNNEGTWKALLGALTFRRTTLSQVTLCTMTLTKVTFGRITYSIMASIGTTFSLIHPVEWHSVEWYSRRMTFSRMTETTPMSFAINSKSHHAIIQILVVPVPQLSNNTRLFRWQAMR